MPRMMRKIGHTAAVLALLFTGVRAAAESSSSQQPQYPYLRIGGFSDFNLLATDEKSAGSTSGFHEGQFVLHFTAALAPRFSFFAEMSVSARQDEFATEIERTILKFQANDRLGLSFGRYHTPINWWNVAFHHGQWLQTSINRPEMTQFGGVFIPVHFVGAVANGVLAAPGGDLAYEAGVGNGRSEPPSRAGDNGDVNNNRAWFATLAIKPDRLYRLDIGGAYYNDLVSTAALGDFDERIVCAHVAWTRETPEIIAEIAYNRHEARLTSATYENWAGYAQVACRLKGHLSRLKPYGRFERLLVEAGDPVLAARIADLNEYTAGIRWDCSDFVALKAEYRRQDYKAVDINALLMQVSFAF
jgi:hypothetical protein